MNRALDATATAADVVARAQELAQTRWERVTGPEVVEIARAVAAARGLLDAALLRVATRLEETRVLDDLGWTSVKDFLTHTTGGHQGAGGGLVRAAERIAGLPAVQDALEDGRITLPQARAIADKVTTLPHDPGFRSSVAGSMLDLVAEQGLDATGLGTAFDDVVREHDPDAALVNAERDRDKAEQAAHHARYLSFAPDQYGGVRVKGYGTVEDVETIKATLLPLSTPVTTEPGACGGVLRRPDEPMFDAHGLANGQPCPNPVCAHDGRDRREAGARIWDALVDACTRLANIDGPEALPRDHGNRARIIVTIDHESLRQQVIDAGLTHAGEAPTGATLSATAIRRLACDAEIIPAVLGTDGQPLDVGRTHRLVTPALWLALIARDRHCAFPGCTRMPLACDAHHITHWADGGATSLSNMVMLCRHHHTVIHHSPWQVRIDTDTGQPVWIPPPRLTLDSMHAAGVVYAPARPRAA